MLRKRTLYPVDCKDRDGNWKLFVQPARWKLERAGWGLWVPKVNQSEVSFGAKFFLPPDRKVG
jgi:hypothetical protein